MSRMIEKNNDTKMLKSMVSCLGRRFEQVMEVLNYGLVAYLWFLIFSELYQMVTESYRILATPSGSITLLNSIGNQEGILDSIGKQVGLVNSILLTICHVAFKKNRLMSRWYLPHIEILGVVSIIVVVYVLRWRLKSMTDNDFTLLCISASCVVVVALILILSLSGGREQQGLQSEEGDGLKDRVKAGLKIVGGKFRIFVEVCNITILSFFWFDVLMDLPQGLNSRYIPDFNRMGWDYIRLLLFGFIGLVNGLFLAIWTVGNPNSKLAKKWLWKLFEICCLVVFLHSLFILAVITKHQSHRVIEVVSCSYKLLIIGVILIVTHKKGKRKEKN